MKLRFVFLFLFSLLTFALHAQEYLTSVRHYNFEKGLETRDFRFSIKDSQGFLWFTSGLGAYRFDGNEFKNFKRKIEGNNPYSIHQLGEDSEKNIWFIHTEIDHSFRYSILPFGKDSLVAIDNFFGNDLPFPSKKLVKTILKPPHFIALIYDNGQVYEYDNDTFTQFLQVPKSKSLDYFQVLRYLDLEKTNDNNYWMVSQDTLFTISTEKVIQKETLPILYLKINKDHQDRIWLHYKKDIYLKENINSPLVPAPFLDYLQGDQVFNRGINHNGFHAGYFLFTNGTSTYDLSLINLDDFSKIKIEPFGTSETNISPYSYFVENPKSIWLNTHDGIYHIQLRKKVFHNYLQGTSTRKMIKDENDNLWVTSNSGFHKINLKEKTVETNSQLGWKYGRDLLWMDSTELWMGRTFGGVSKFDLSQSKLEKEYLLFEKFDFSISFNFIHQDKKSQQIWAGVSSGLLLYDKNKDDFFLFNHQGEFSQFDSIKNTCFGEFENFNLIGTPVGIFEFAPNKGFTKHFSTKNNTLPYDNIVHIHQDKEDGTFWLGTKFGGMIHWDKKNNTSKTFTTEQGLSDNLIYSVYEDDEGYLWLSSNIGIMRFNKKTEEVITFTTDDGLPYDEFNYNSHFQDEEGNLFFGGLNGITTFHPNDLPKTKESAPLQITHLDVLDTKKGEMISRRKEFSENKNLVLSPSEKHVQITVALLDFQKPTDNQYAYKIEGYDNKWKIIKGNIINIHELPSGDFNVFIKAKNPHDAWADEILNVPIHVQKPFYLRWWFILSAIVLFFALVILLIRMRTANLISKTQKLEQEVARRTKKIQKDKEIIEQDKILIEKQANELQKLDELKTRFFANVTHELRTPLTLITSPLQRLLNTQKLDPKVLQTLQNIAQNGEHLKDLVEEILDLSRLEGGKLSVEKKPVHFQRKTKEWFQTFDAIAHNRGIDYQLNYQLPPKLHLNIDIKKTQKIVFNLLSNAFKFSKSGDVITIDISGNKNNAVIKVSDTGEGIHEDDLPFIFDRFYQSKQINQNLNGGLGIGLALSKELAHLMNGQLTVESVLGKGTTFTFEFPKETIIREPVVVDENVFAPSIISQPTVPTSTFEHTILIVEDHLQMQAFVQELLQSFSNTIIANNGNEALDILNKNNQKVDLIVSDVMMPEMDGFTFLDIIKNNPQWHLIPTIMLTARADISDKLNALTIGVDDYLIKPFEPEELVARVKNLMENVDLRKKIIQPPAFATQHIAQEPTLAPLDSADIKWVKKLEALAFEKVTSPNFNISQLAHEMAIGERQLNRKVKKITGLTPGSYLKEIKLQKARQLLENKAYSTVAEVSYLIGFGTPSYFSTQYKKRFGKLPSDYFKD